MSPAGETKAASGLWRWFPLAVVLAVGAVSIGSGVSLFADGANFFQLTRLHPGIRLDPERAWVGALMRQPFALAIAGGVRDSDVLRAVFSLSVVGLPTLAWAYVLVRASALGLLWPAAALYAVVYLNTGFFAISEFNLTYPLVVAVALSLVRREATSPRAALATLALSIPLLKSYESVAFLAPALLILLVVAVRREDERLERASVVLLSAAAVVLALSGWNAVESVRSGYTERDAEAARGWTSNPQFVISNVVFLSIIASRLPMPARIGTVNRAVGFGAVGLLLLPAFRAAPVDHYHLRIGALVPVLAFLLFLPLARHRGEAPRGDPGRTGRARALALQSVLALFFASHAVGFGRFLGQVEGRVQSGAGVIAYESLEGLDERYVWPWAMPVLSLALQDRPACAVITAPESYDGWMPFDPGEPPPASFGGPLLPCSER